MQQGAKAARGPQRLAAGKAQAGCAAPPRTRLAPRQGRSGVAASAWPRPSASCPPSGSRRDAGCQSGLCASAPLDESPVRPHDWSVRLPRGARTSTMLAACGGSRDRPLRSWACHRCGRPPAAVRPPAGSAASSWPHAYGPVSPRGPEATTGTSGLPVRARLPHALGNTRPVRSWLRCPAADAPTTPAVALSGTR
jgi:hypothetical protein